ncbi:hypothetical protein C8J30_102197 [Rhodobacter viridis]|uniref:Flagellar FliJ protein n=2 Tax=Rhodobacter viridis TaxID=1054202 RepID=A0A318U980_9RHOB|nr:hypothetical protein C8J30_102197 [Rhodobacter viridis]
MKRKDLESMNDIASMIRDREMAELAKLNLRRLRLEAERQKITQDVQAAWKAGGDNLMSARAAESFEKWAQMRHAQIDDLMANLQPLIDAQKQRTAAATGRHRNLGEIARQLLEERQKAKEKRL